MLNLSLIKKRIKKEGETAELLCLLSRYYNVKKKDYQKALEYAEKAISTDKNYGYAYFRKGAILYSLNKFEEAHIFLRKSKKLGYSNYELFGVLSHVLSKQDDFQQALIYANKAISYNEKYANGYFVKGISEYYLKDKENALKSFFLAKKLGCKNGSLYEFISYILYEKNEYGKALKYLSKAIKAQPDNSKLYCLEGYILYELDKDAEAKEQLLKAEELGYKHDDLYCKLSYIYSMEKDYKTSLQYADKAILVNPADDFAYHRKGYALLYMEKFKEAKKYYLKAEQLGYQYEGMFMHLAGLFCLESDFNTALSYINKAIIKRSNDIDYYSLKAEILLNLGKQKEAEKCYKKISKLKK